MLRLRWTTMWVMEMSPNVSWRQDGIRQQYLSLWALMLKLHIDGHRADLPGAHGDVRSCTTRDSPLRTRRKDLPQTFPFFFFFLVLTRKDIVPRSNQRRGTPLWGSGHHRSRPKVPPQQHPRHAQDRGWWAPTLLRFCNWGAYKGDNEDSGGWSHRTGCGTRRILRRWVSWDQSLFPLTPHNPYMTRQGPT